MAAPTSGTMTEFRLSEVDAMVGQGTSVGCLGAPTLVEAALGFGSPPGRKLVSAEKCFRRSKYYPSQSAKTMLKDFFNLHSRKTLNPGHTTTSLSADQMIQFSRAFVVEVILSWNGLLEDFLVRSPGVSVVGLRWVSRRSPHPSAVGSFLSDGFASRSR